MQSATDGDILYRYEERVRPIIVVILLVIGGLWFGFVGYRVLVLKEPVTPVRIMLTMAAIAFGIVLIVALYRGGTNFLEIDNEKVRWHYAGSGMTVIEHSQVDSYEIVVSSGDQSAAPETRVRLKSGQILAVPTFADQPSVQRALQRKWTFRGTRGGHLVGWESADEGSVAELDGRCAAGREDVKSKRPSMTVHWSLVCPLGLGSATLIAIGAITVAMGIVWIVETSLFVGRASTSVGEVIRGEPGGGTTSRVTFEFKDAAGVLQTKESRFQRLYTAPPFQAGDQVSVLYDAADVDNAQIDSFETLWFAPLLVLGGGVIVVVLGLVLSRIQRLVSWFNES